MLPAFRFAAKDKSLLAVDFLSFDPAVEAILVLLASIAERAAFWPRVTAPFCWGLGEAANLALDFFKLVRAARLPPFMEAAFAAFLTDAGEDLDGPPPGVDANRPEASLTY